MNPDSFTHPHPADHMRINKIKLPNFLRVDMKDNERAKQIHEIKLKYFDGLADVMIEQYSQMMQDNNINICTWTLASNL